MPTDREPLRRRPRSRRALGWLIAIGTVACRAPHPTPGAAAPGGARDAATPESAASSAVASPSQPAVASPSQPAPSLKRRALAGRPPAPHLSTPIDPGCPLEGTWRGDDRGAAVSLRIVESQLSERERAEYAPYRKLCLEQLTGPPLAPGAPGPLRGCSPLTDGWELRLEDADIDYLYEYEGCPLRVRRVGPLDVVLERASP